MHDFSRYLGLDVGERRIGLALSDPLGITAQGLETYHRTSLDKDYAYLSDLIDRENIKALVVGLPKNMNNSLGFKAEETQDFIGGLLAHKDLPVHWVDERLTTVQANHVLLEADVSRKKRKKSVDMLASVFILQTFLDRL